MAPHRHSMTTPDQILHKALEMETHARDFYSKLAAGCSIHFVKELLEKLQNEEYRHICMVQDMIRRLEAGKDVV